ncbi:helix-turn-helix domain-containing protein [Sphingomonas sp.]|uniref:helix-turn-helix domain-containing protein n=1 Tax=Sphingomonas sp. TaxID=28214 RepID=UPI0025FA5D33|nr:helix-turn-helix domain-containing protein [Sphingomonas sp.]
MNNSPKIAYTVPEAMSAIGIGRTFLYRLAKQGRLDLRRVGGRTLVTAASLQRLIDEAEVA